MKKNQPVSDAPSFDRIKQLFEQYLDKNNIAFLKAALNNYKKSNKHLSDLQEKEIILRLITDVAKPKLAFFLENPHISLTTDLLRIVNIIEEFTTTTKDPLSILHCYLFIAHARCPKNMEDIKAMKGFVDFSEARKFYQKALEIINPLRNNKNESDRVFELLFYTAKIGISTTNFLSLLKKREIIKTSSLVLPLIEKSDEPIESVIFLERIYQQYFDLHALPVNFEENKISAEARFCLALINSSALIITQYLDLITQVLSYYPFNKIIETGDSSSSQLKNFKTLLDFEKKTLEALFKIYGFYFYIYEESVNDKYTIWIIKITQQLIENREMSEKIRSTEIKVGEDLKKRQENFENYLKELTTHNEKYKLRINYQKMKLPLSPNRGNKEPIPSESVSRNKNKNDTLDEKITCLSQLESAYHDFTQGKFTEAISKYKAFLTKNYVRQPNLNVAALTGIADCYNAVLKNGEHTDKQCNEVRKKAINALQTAKKTTETLLQGLESHHADYDKLEIQLDFINYDLEKLRKIKKIVSKKIIPPPSVSDYKSTPSKNKYLPKEKHTPNFFKTSTSRRVEPHAPINNPNQIKTIEAYISTNDAAKYVLSRLKKAGFSHFIVGGFIRDTLLGRTPHDCDIVTNALPEEIVPLFPESERVDGGGFAHVSIKIGDENIQVSTFRAGDHQIAPSSPVTFGNLSQDWSTRDFTINALYYDPERNIIIDHCNGRKDIEEKTIRLIGNPDERIKHDPIRILRAIRFSSSLNFTIHSNTEKAIKDNKCLLAELPNKNKLFSEIKKLFFHGSSEKVFCLLEEFKLLEVPFPACADALKHNPLFRDFLSLELHEMDQAFYQEKPLNRALFFAVLFYGPFLQAEQLPSSKAIEEMLNVQAAIIPIPEPMLNCIKSIWMFSFANNLNAYPDFRTYTLAIKFFDLMNRAKQNNNTAETNGVRNDDDASMPAFASMTA
jgi:poly(A) polymerase